MSLLQNNPLQQQDPFQDQQGQSGSAPDVGRGMAEQEELRKQNELKQQQAIEEQQKKMQLAAQRITSSLDKLHLPQTKENATNVIKAASEGRPLQPKALVAHRRAEIRKSIDDIKHNLNSDFEIHRMNEQIKQGEKVDPKLKKIASERMKFLNARVLGFQKQLLELDGLENRISLAEGLDGADYQDAITQLLTGQKVSTSTTLEKRGQDRADRQLDRAEFESDRNFEAGRRDEGFDRAIELGEAGQKEAQLEINKQLADARTLEGQAAKQTALTLGKAGEGDIDKQIIGLEKTFSQLNDLASNFDLDAFTVSDKLSKWGVGALDKLDMTNPEQKQFLERRRVQAQTINSIFNSYRKLITGAAASEKELEKLEESILNVNLAPSEARAALRSLMVNIVRDQQILTKLKAEGIDNKDAQFESSFLTQKLEFDKYQREGIEKQITGKYPHLAPPQEAPIKGPDGKMYTREELKKIGGVS